MMNESGFKTASFKSTKLTTKHKKYSKQYSASKKSIRSKHKPNKHIRARSLIRLK